MTASLQTYQWTTKTTLSRHLVFGCIILILAIIVAFKMKPYFIKRKKISVHSTKDKTSSSKTQDQMREDLSKANLDQARPPMGGNSSPGHSTYSRASATSHSDRSRVLERPLFDNLTVTVSATLLTGISSSQTESGAMAVEAKVVQLIADENSLAFDSGDFSLTGATLLGSASPQFGLKKMNLQFTELVSTEGKRFSITGVALDPQTNAVGVDAKYSSGMASRLLGVTLGRALQTTDQMVSTRVLENTSDADPLSRAVARQGIEASQQPITDLNQEVTKDLRETRAVLSLDAGTPLTVRLKSQTTAGRSHQ